MGASSSNSSSNSKKQSRGNTLRINTSQFPKDSGLRQRRRNQNDNNDDMDDDEANKGHLYIEDQSQTKWNTCIIWLILWIASYLGAVYLSQNYVCDITTSVMGIRGCEKIPDFVYTPTLMDHVITKMKSNYKVRTIVNKAVVNKQFISTAIWKKNLYSIEFSESLKRYTSNNEHNLDISISVIVYSNQFNSRIGEIGIPLTALYYENSIDSMTIIDDTNHMKSAELWEYEILFRDQTPSIQLNIDDLPVDQSVRNIYYKWDLIDSVKANNKHILRTSSIGIWKGIEMGSRLSYIPKTKTQKLTEIKQNNIDLMLLLDTYHQLAMNDEWIRNALALFEQYPNLQVLGGFSGIIKNGNTFGDINIKDRRTTQMDNEAQVFILSREHDYLKQLNNKRKYDDARINIVDHLDNLKEQYYDKYWKSFMKKAKKKWEKGTLFDDDTDSDDTLYSTSFMELNRDKMIFLNSDDPDYDTDRVQTGLEAVSYVLKKRFLERYEPEIQARLPIRKKLLKKIREKREECLELLKDAANLDPITKENCEVIVKPQGRTMVDYHFIPYEQQIRIWDDIIRGISTTYIPFMFITAVRMGPIFIRKNWWFDKLLPHLTNLDKTMGKMEEEWFDIEISLYTWALGGYVGLYDAEGFKYDRKQFDIGVRRNRKADKKWKTWEENHLLAQEHLNWNIWNVTHLVDLNEKYIEMREDDENNYDFYLKNKDSKLRLRTSMDDSSTNPQHPVALENSRQILLTLKEFERVFDITEDDNHDTNDIDIQQLLRLKKESNINLEDLHKNPFN